MLFHTYSGKKKVRTNIKVKAIHNNTFNRFKGRKKVSGVSAQLSSYIAGGKDKFSTKHTFQSFENSIMMQLKSDNNVLYKSVSSCQDPYQKPKAPSKLNRQEHKIWIDKHGKEAIKKQTNEAISLIMSSICPDYESLVLVVMPNIYVSERKSDVRKLMKTLKVVKDEERAPNKAAKKSLAFQDLVSAQQEGGETFPAYLKRVQDLSEELRSSGQEMDEQLVANVAIKGLSPKYASIEEEAEKNSLYASTSKTGESNSGLVIKTIADVAKACRAIDASIHLKRSNTPVGKPRNYNIRDNRPGGRGGRGRQQQGRGRGRSGDRGRGRGQQRRPICFDCYNSNLPSEHNHTECPNQGVNEVHVNTKRSRNPRKEENDENDDDDDADVEEEEPKSRTVFQVVRRLKKQRQ